MRSFASLVSEGLIGISEDDVEGICTSLNTEQLSSICDKMGIKGGTERAAVLRDAQGLSHRSENEKQGQKQSRQQDGAVQVNGSLPFVSSEK